MKHIDSIKYHKIFRIFAQLTWVDTILILLKIDYIPVKLGSAVTTSNAFPEFHPLVEKHVLIGKIAPF